MSCGTKSTQQKESTEVTSKTAVGGDRDEHGCIGSAGYQWSELLRDCIRPFEKGIRMKSTDDKQTSAAYLVFNADSTKVELYLPKKETRPILNQETTVDGETIWVGNNEDQWSVRCIEHIWGIYFNSELQFVRYQEDK